MVSNLHLFIISNDPSILEVTNGTTPTVRGLENGCVELTANSLCVHSRQPVVSWRAGLYLFVGRYKAISNLC